MNEMSGNGWNYDSEQARLDEIHKKDLKERAQKINLKIWGVVIEFFFEFFELLVEIFT